MTRAAVLINPTAGAGRAGALAPQALARLQQRGIQTVAVTGRDAAHARTLLHDAIDSGVEAIIACGGDGTVHLALPYAIEAQIPLGVIALGSGDDIAREHALPRRAPVVAADRIVDALERGLTTTSDAMRITTARGQTRWALGVLASGFDTDVNEKANRMRRGTGVARYVSALVRTLPTFKPSHYEVTVDGLTTSVEAMLVAVGNGRGYGSGMQVCPGARTDDGLLDITIVEPITRTMFVRLFPQVYRGAHITHPAVRTMRGAHVRLVSAGRTAWADGERVGELPVDIVCVPDAVRLLT